MCGFVGCYAFDGKLPEHINDSVIESVCRLLWHRGPDQGGVYIDQDEGLVLGHRRLSILDLSEHGKQPMLFELEKLALVFNGEIYNYRSLKKELETKGYRFIGNSDSEVILYLYAEYGIAMLDRMEGMFAFFLFDGARKKCILARDRIGKKPLYYSLQNGVLYFGSTIRSLIALSQNKYDLNHKALYHLNTFRCVPAPETFWDDIKKVRAAHYITFDKDGLKESRYWDPLALPADISISRKEAGIRIRELLVGSVNKRMVSDVEVGAFLSGGIDSSAIVKLMSECAHMRPKTFCVGIAGYDEQNEFEEARAMAERVGTDHHEYLITPTDLENHFEDIIRHQDEPIADPVCVSNYFVAKLAHEHGIKVVLTGEGSDELFCGYPYWLKFLKYEKAAATLGRLPGMLRRLGLSVGGMVLASHSTEYEYMRRIFNRETIFWGGTRVFTEGMKHLLFSSEFLDALGQISSYSPVAPYWNEYMEKRGSRDYLNFMTYLDMNIRLPDLLLMRADKMSMAHSVEARAPFLDHELAEFVLTLPQAVKVGAGEMKSLLKQALDGVLPQEVLYAPKKGFGAPVSFMYKGQWGREMGERIRGFNQRYRYFNQDVIEAMLKAKDTRLWPIANFVMWFDLANTQ